MGTLTNTASPPPPERERHAAPSPDSSATGSLIGLTLQRQRQALSPASGSKVPRPRGGAGPLPFVPGPPPEGQPLAVATMGIPALVLDVLPLEPGAEVRVSVFADPIEPAGVTLFWEDASSVRPERRGVRVTLAVRAFRRAALERVAKRLAALASSSERGWVLQVARGLSGEIGGLAFELSSADDPQGASLQIGWTLQRLVDGVSDLTALRAPDFIDASGLLGSALSIGLGGPLPKRDPLIGPFACRPPDALVDALGLGDMEQLRVSVYREASTYRLCVFAEGEPTGGHVTVDADQLLGAARRLAGPLVGRQPRVGLDGSRAAGYGGPGADLSQRVEFRPDRTIRLHLGRDPRSGDWVAIKLEQLLGAYDDLTRLVPTQIHLRSASGRVDLHERPERGGLDLRPAGHSEPVIKLPDLECPSALSALLRVVRGEALEVCVYWGGGRLAVTARGAADDASHGLAIEVEAASLAERMSRAVERFVPSGKRFGPTAPSDWLGTARVEVRDESILAFRFATGGASGWIGYRLEEQLPRLLTQGPRGLESLAPDEIDIDLDSGLAGVSLHKAKAGDARPALEEGFELLGVTEGLETPPAMQLLAAPGAREDDSPPRMDVAFGYRQQGGLTLGVGVLLRGSPPRQLFVYLDTAPMVEKVAKIAGQNSFVQWLRRLSVGGGREGLDPSKYLEFAGGMLRLSDAGGDNVVGFDLTRFLDGFDRADLIPSEVKLKGNPSIELGAVKTESPTPDQTPPGRAVRVAKPTAGLELPEVVAPDAIAALFGAAPGSKIALVVATEPAEAPTHAILYGTCPSGSADSRALRVTLALTRLRERAARIARRVQGFGLAGGAPERRQPKARVRFASDFSKSIKGLGFDFGYEGHLAGRLGYSASRLLSALTDPVMLAVPDRLELELLASGVEVALGASLQTPEWVESAEPVVAGFTIPSALQHLLGSEATDASLFADLDSAEALRLFIQVKGTNAAKAGPGLALNVPAKVIEGLRDRFKKLLDRTRKGTAKRSIAERLGADGLRLYLGDPSRLYVHYNWGGLLELIASRKLALGQLVPDGLRIGNLEYRVSVSDAPAQTKLPNELRLSALPDDLREWLTFLGVDEGGRLGFDYKQLSVGSEALEQGRRTFVNLPFYVQASEDSALKKVEAQVSVVTLLRMVLPEALLRRLQAGKRGRRGVRITLDPKKETLTISLSKRFKGGRRLEMRAGWKLTSLIELLQTVGTEGLDGLTSNLQQALPDTGSISIRGREYGLEVGVLQGPPKEGLHQAKLARLPLVAQGLEGYLSDELLSTAQIGVGAPSLEQLVGVLEGDKWVGLAVQLTVGSGAEARGYYGRLLVDAWVVGQLVGKVLGRAHPIGKLLCLLADILRDPEATLEAIEDFLYAVKNVFKMGIKKIASAAYNAFKSKKKWQIVAALLLNDMRMSDLYKARAFIEALGYQCKSASEFDPKNMTKWKRWIEAAEQFKASGMSLEEFKRRMQDSPLHQEIAASGFVLEPGQEHEPDSPESKGGGLARKGGRPSTKPEIRRVPKRFRQLFKDLVLEGEALTAAEFELAMAAWKDRSDAELLELYRNPPSKMKGTYLQMLQVYLAARFGGTSQAQGPDEVKKAAQQAHAESKRAAAKQRAANRAGFPDVDVAEAQKKNARYAGKYGVDPAVFAGLGQHVKLRTAGGPLTPEEAKAVAQVLAVAAFQQSAGLRVDGIHGENTILAAYTRSGKSRAPAVQKVRAARAQRAARRARRRARSKAARQARARQVAELETREESRAFAPPHQWFYARHVTRWDEEASAFVRDPGVQEAVEKERWYESDDGDFGIWGIDVDIRPLEVPEDKAATVQAAAFVTTRVEVKEVWLDPDSGQRVVKPGGRKGTFVFRGEVQRDREGGHASADHFDIIDPHRVGRALRYKSNSKRGDVLEVTEPVVRFDNGLALRIERAVVRHDFGTEKTTGLRAVSIVVDGTIERAIDTRAVTRLPLELESEIGRPGAGKGVPNRTGARIRGWLVRVPLQVGAL